MNPYNYLFHPYFLIPLFLLLGIVIFLAPLYAHKKKIKIAVFIFISIVFLIIIVPNFMAVAVWFLVNKLHWIK